MKVEEVRDYLIRGGAWAFSGKIVTAGLGLALSALLARMLSPADFGTYLLALSVATFLSTFGRFGIENTLLRFVSESVSICEFQRIKSAVFKGVVVLVVASSVVAILYNVYFGRWLARRLFDSPELSQLSMLVAIWSMVLAFQFVLSEIFRGFKDIRLSVLIGTVISLIFSIIFLSSIWALSITISLAAVLIACIAATGISVLIGTLKISGRVSRLPDSGELNCTYREILHQSWPLLLNTATVYFISQTDLWIVGIYRSQEDVAVYGAAMRLVMLVTVICGIANSIVLPLISQFYILDKRKELESILRSTASLAGLPAVVVIVWFFFFSEWTLAFIFGAKYSGGGFILQALSFAQVAIVFIGPCAAVLTLTGQQRVLLTINALIGLSSLIVKIPMIQLFGTSGLAVASAFITIIQMLILLKITHIRCGIWTYATFKPRFSTVYPGR